jgi:hypothetical protein
MPKKPPRPAVVTVVVDYVDYSTGQPRGEPTSDEWARMADRLVQAATTAALGADVRAVRRQATEKRG